MGVLVARLPTRASVIFGRSACPHCGTRLSAWDLVPLVSFLLLRGRCRYCREPIALFHVTIEIAAATVALWAVSADSDPVRIWVDCGLGWTLLTLTWIDCSSFLLPDVLTLPLLLAGLAYTFGSVPEELTDHCIAAVFAYLAFEGLAFAYRWLRGREGLGGGDAKLIAAAGAWCGLALLPFVVLGSAIVGLLAALGMVLNGQAVTSRTRIPYGPCIALVFWLAWLYGGLLDQFFGRP